MSDHIENEGKKGYCMMFFFIALLLFVVTWASVYWSNFSFTFGS